MTAKAENPMRRLHIPRIVVNMGVGESGEKLAKAETLLEELTGQRPIRTYSSATIKPWDIRKGAPIGCKVTLYDDKKDDFLKRALDAVERKIKLTSLDGAGNFSFGIREHIDLAGMKYNPSVGIFGMDISVSVERPGYRIKRRKRLKSKPSKHHLIKKEDTMDFLKSSFNVELVEEVKEDYY